MILEFLLVLYTITIIFLNLAQLYLFKILPALSSKFSADFAPLVSIIVPAKNEESKIKDCIDSLIAQDYKNKEIIVVLGESKDRTEEILKQYEDEIKVIREPPLPKGWVGKNWACYIGYLHSKGEYLLFTDADTIHDKKLLSIAVSKMEEEKLDLLTLIPSLLMNSRIIKLILPVIGQFVYVVTLAPFFNKKSKLGVFGNGQYMLFRRKSYEKVGGHASVKNKILEDFNLARIFKNNSFETRLYNALSLFKVRMYDDFKELSEGWGKNLFIGLGAKLSYLILAILALIIVYLFPFILLLIGIYNFLLFDEKFFLFYASIINLFYFFRFGIIYYKLNVNYLYGFLYFLSIILLISILFFSYLRFRKGIHWKGRVYQGEEVL